MVRSSRPGMGLVTLHHNSHLVPSEIRDRHHHGRYHQGLEINNSSREPVYPSYADAADVPAIRHVANWFPAAVSVSQKCDNNGDRGSQSFEDRHRGECDNS